MVSSNDERVWRAPPDAPVFDVRMDAAAGTMFVRGDLDVETAGLLLAAVDRQVAQDAVDLLVDLGDLDFFDLAGLDALQAAQQRAQARGGRLLVVNHDPFFARVAGLCGADSLLDGSLGGSLDGSGT